MAIMVEMWYHQHVKDQQDVTLHQLYICSPVQLDQSSSFSPLLFQYQGPPGLEQGSLDVPEGASNFDIQSLVFSR